MGRYNTSIMRSPKEEQQVPESVDVESSRTENVYPTRNADDKIDILDELESILGIEERDNLLGDNLLYGDGLIELNFMEWDEFPINNNEEPQYKDDDEEEEEYEAEEEFYHEVKNTSEFLDEEQTRYGNITKRENLGFEEEEEEEEKKISLNLNLNYQEVMDAWSNRGSLWATDDYSQSMANNTFMGEVPVMEEEKTRREAKVLRYKEKRQSRLFSKKIRYQVRKLNAEKRPRLKGRFVKRVPEKIFIR
ncbi:CCT domain [Macleaya cordata]|uniref:CCT domain n=1 Tax=Macleaya cordata TaxID=56857 RepID=A0A200PLU7_MACCD|nr:CCT domain [Macleaya cordata]